MNFKMQSMRRNMHRTVTSHLSYAQTFLVFVAFGIMVALSYRYAGDAGNKNLEKLANNALSNAQVKIEAELREARTNLGGFSQTVRLMIMNGNGLDKVQDYFTEIARQVFSDGVNMEGFDGLYGYFESGDLKGINIHNERGTPKDFDATERPWYKDAIKAKGKIAVTSPYESVISNNKVITFSRQIFDDDGNSLGIIGLDIKMERIAKHVIDVALYEGSYGILFDENYNVLIHPHPSYLGKSVRLMNDGEAILSELNRGDIVFGRKVVDYRNMPAIAFMKQFENGWVMGIITLEEEFYKPIRHLLRVLVLLGSIMAIVLSFILVRVISARIKVNERMQAILNSTPLGINVWNRKFQNTETNDEAVRLFGLSSKGEYLDKFYELSPEFQPDGKASSEKAIELVKKAFDEGSCRFEWMHQKLDGEQMPCEITLIRIADKDDFIVLGYTRDLRELKTMLAKMREAEERTQIMFNSMPLCANFRTKEKGIIDCNEEALRLFGFKNKMEYIRDSLKIYPPRQPDGSLSTEKAKVYINKAFEDGYNRFEWTYQALDGELIPCEVTFVRVKYKDDYVLATYMRDLREFKAMMREMRKAEMAEASNKAKSKFLAVMSHEIRTPMNAILGITEIQLQDEALPSHIKDAFNEIYNSGDLLLNIINDILDLSKIEADKMELNIGKYEVASLINDTVHLNIMRNSKPIEFDIDVSEETPLYLLGDELRVKQILNNLLSNAFKYTDEGIIKLSVCVEKNEEEKDGVMLVFKISDTGRGLTKDQIEKLFEEYTRFNTETNRYVEGVGLGMNITQRLVGMMSGKIFVESEPRKGSTFTVHLPQGLVNAQVLGKELVENLSKFRMNGVKQMRKTQILREPMPYGNILIVDDVASNLYVAKGLMLPYGLTIETASSGESAIEKIKSGSVYDIIFMDHMMPGIDGMEATKILRGLNYANPIVALTANAVVGQAEEFLKNGFDAFISKPIDVRQLNSILNKYVRDRQPREVIERARKQGIVVENGAMPKIDSALIDVFLLDAKKSLPILEATLKNVKKATDEELRLFVINAHAMKSALANIGESIASQRAFVLEKAGREQNRNVIGMQSKLLIDEIRKIVGRFESKSESPETDINEDAAYLREQLQIICKACADYDERPIIASLEELKKHPWKKENKLLIEKISEHVLFSAFDEAGALAAEHLKA
jgi:signal transduction histidine kinase/CheY-like chemotaxis protein